MNYCKKQRPAFESKFAFTTDTTLVSYAPKKNKSVLLLSTMHAQEEVDIDREERKPYMIHDYNMTKGAVDAFDQQIKGYTCTRKTRRWPMRLFLFVVDAAAFNGCALWLLKNPTWMDRMGSKRLDKRRLFLLEVS